MSAPLLIQKINEKSPINSPIFIGIPQAPTPNDNDSSTKIATTEFVNNQVDNNTKFVKKTGDTMSGDLTISKTGSIDGCYSSVANDNGKISLHVQTNRGVWDDVRNKWMVWDGPSREEPHINGSAESLTFKNWGGSATTVTWHNKLGCNVYAYEQSDIESLNLPRSQCVIFTMIYSTKRGVALAINWDKSAPLMWINRLHDDAGTFDWEGWTQVWCDGNDVYGAVWN